MVPAVLLVSGGCGCSTSRYCIGGTSVPAGTIVLFDGTDFSHWKQEDGRDVQWKIVDGAMQVAVGQGSIVTKQKFQDFKLHVEFNVPPAPQGDKKRGYGNSGVYLQRRYEVQILDSYGIEAGEADCGALYRAKAPDKNVCKEPGRWQSYDIIFRAARFGQQGQQFKKVENACIIVWHNGVLIHNNVELADKTGAGQPEGPQPGPILLQDHGNPVRFRNIRVERF